MLILALLTSLYHALKSNESNNIDFGLIAYLIMSNLFGLFFNLEYFNKQHILSVYQVLIVPFVFLARVYHWLILLFTLTLFIFLCCFDVFFEKYLTLNLIFIGCFLFYHLKIQKKLVFKRNDIFIIYIFVMSFLFDLFDHYPKFWMHSQYKSVIHIFYLFFINSFYTYLIFNNVKLAKS